MTPKRKILWRKRARDAILYAMPAPRRIELSDGILPRLQQRVPDAYDELFRVAGPALLQFAATIVQSADAAEDVVQDVVYRIWELGIEFRPSGSVVSYLFTAIRNRALNHRRHETVESRYRDRATQPDTNALSGASGLSEREYDVDDLADRIREIVARLPERQRAAFTLRYGQGMTIPEVAEVLGITVGSAGNLLTRTTRTVREQLGIYREAKEEIG